MLNFVIETFEICLGNTFNFALETYLNFYRNLFSFVIETCLVLPKKHVKICLRNTFDFVIETCLDLHMKWIMCSCNHFKYVEEQHYVSWCSWSRCLTSYFTLRSNLWSASTLVISTELTQVCPYWDNRGAKIRDNGHTCLQLRKYA